MPKAVKHYLITIDVGTAHLHGYVMTNDKRDCMGVADQMIKLIEDKGAWYLPMILQTELSIGGKTDPTSVEFIRSIIRSMSDEGTQALSTATSFHMSVFATPKDDPDDVRLMALH